MSDTKTIYDHLGDERLQQLIRVFYSKVFVSPDLSPLFDESTRETIMDKQYCFLTQYLGGPFRYNEKYGIPRMRQSHLKHVITPKHRDEWLKLMKESIETLDCDDKLKVALYNCFPMMAEHMTNSE